VTVSVALRLPTGEAIARAVEANLGIAIIPRMVVERDVALGHLANPRIEDLDLRRTFRMVRARAFTPSPASVSFADVVRGRAAAAGLV
jgi:DNA-binding transcriptional LysR family regulator